MSKLNRTLSVLAMAGAILFAVATAQEPPRAESTTPNSDPGGEKVVTVRQMVEPAFRVEPIVHRLKAGRGEILPFAYLIESNGKEMDVELKLVALRQEENGVVLHDEAALPTNAMKLLTPSEFTISAGKSATIRGEITIPTTKTNYHSYGILVRDRGQFNKLAPKLDAQGKRITQAGVRFITQYVLRCDIEVTNGSAAKVSEIAVESGDLVPVDGWAVARAYVQNPTDTAIECSVRAALPTLDPSGRAKFFPLGLPARAEMNESEKFVVRILPKSRVRLEAKIPTSVKQGEHPLHVEILAGQAHGAKGEFLVKIIPSDFPGQESAVVQLTPAISVSPGRLQLSKLKGGRTTQPLVITNSSSEAEEVSFTGAGLDGNALAGLELPRKSITIKPHSSQTIMAMIRSQKGKSKPECGFVRIIPKNAPIGSAEGGQIPLMLMYGAPEEPNLEFADLELHKGERPSFVLKVTNKGDGFVPVDGMLNIADENGGSLRMGAGYGKWLMPGETRELAFKASSAIPDGKYQIHLEIRTFDQMAPLITKSNITIGEVLAPSATNKTAATQPK